MTIQGEKEGMESVFDQFSCGNDYALKVRKPYTITKQREKWTDEEHKKFLEALKLYSRAWRKIEEHVGTKTAVQIRSHAQKFFSKINRDTSGNDTTMVESIEIPPPRPKRKPIHPYPRKLVEIPKNEISNLEKPLRSNSLVSLDFGQENKSPKSVLSAVASETLGFSDSDSPTESLSPVSSISAIPTSSSALLESKLSSSEEDVSLQIDELNACSAHDKQLLVKLELFSKECVSTKDKATEESETPCRTLKLFGTTLLVKDTRKPSTSSTDLPKPLPTMHLAQKLQGGCLDIGLIGSNNTSSINDEESSKRLDNNQAKNDRAHYLVGQATPPSITMRHKTFGVGFVPYKRCMAERERQCSKVTDERREHQRMRLSL